MNGRRDHSQDQTSLESRNHCEWKETDLLHEPTIQLIKPFRITVISIILQILVWTPVSKSYLRLESGIIGFQQAKSAAHLETRLS